jgi:hypothetical protein
VFRHARLVHIVLSTWHETARASAVNLTEARVSKKTAIAWRTFPIHAGYCATTGWSRRPMNG